MENNLTSLGHLRAASLEAKDLIAEVAGASAEAIEEVADSMVTMDQVNAAIQAAVGSAMEGAY